MYKYTNDICKTVNYIEILLIMAATINSLGIILTKVSRTVSSIIPVLRSVLRLKYCH